MESRAFTVSLTKNPVINTNIIPGHFTTSHFHTNCYVDLDKLKTNALVAKDVAAELALPYLKSTYVDTIVCIEGTEVIGAYMAEELLKKGLSGANSDRDIHVVTPKSNVNKQLTFQHNIQKVIYNKRIVLLASSVSSGITLNSALDCLSYYGGILAGVSALFNAYPNKHEQKVNSLFTSKDIPDYQLYSPGECIMCKKGLKLDAIIVHDGYIRM
jgi:orotate phosphoribosyltransferase